MTRPQPDGSCGKVPGAGETCPCLTGGGRHISASACRDHLHEGCHAVAELSDIGLTRADLRYGQSLPYDVDPIAELSHKRQRNAAKGQRHP